MSDALARARPFLFDRSFDDEARRRAARKKAEAETQAAAEAEPEAPPPPTYSEEELSEAKKQAWSEGHAAGVAEAKQQQDAEADALLESVAAQVSGLHVHQDIANERLAAEVAALGVEIVRKMMPVYAKRHGLDEVKAVLEECLQRVPREGRMSVSVAETARDAIDPHLELLAARSGYEGRMTLLTDPELGPAEVSVTWDNGGVDRLDAALWEKLDEILARALEKAMEAPVAEPATSAPVETEPAAAADPDDPGETARDVANGDEPAPETAERTAATSGDSGHSAPAEEPGDAGEADGVDSADPGHDDANSR